MKNLIDSTKEVIILGDFNICFKSESQNKVFEELKEIGFKQLVKYSSHEEGRMIDLVFDLSPSRDAIYETIQQSRYFTDHDLIEVVR